MLPFEPFFRIESKLPSAFDTHGRSDDRIWFALYLPIKHLTENISSLASLLQHGRIHLYLTYTFVTLVVLLAFV